MTVAYFTIGGAVGALGIVALGYWTLVRLWTTDEADRGD